MKRLRFVIGLTVFMVAAMPRNADACSVNSGYCLSDTNTYSPGSGILGGSTGSPAAGVTGAAAQDGTGVYGVSASGVGVSGESINGGYGVLGVTTGNDGGHFESGGTANDGVWGSGGNAGVYGTSTTGYGVYGTTTANNWAVFGTATSGDGVYGLGGATGGYGGLFEASGPGSTYGVYGYATGTTGSNYGLYGQATASSSGTGVYGTGGKYGVYGNGDGAGSFGVYATCSGSCNALETVGQSIFDGDMALNSAHSLYWGLTCEIGACVSDRRLKKDIQPLSDALGKLLQINGVTYEWKSPDAHHPMGIQKGVIAQDVETVFPEWVTETPEGMKAVNIDQRAMLGLTVEAFRTLKTENDGLRGRVDDLRERVKSLEDGRRPMMSGFGEGWIGAGLLGVAGALVISRRKRPEPKV